VTCHGKACAAWGRLDGSGRDQFGLHPA
jgi:hypothetical protein